MNRRSFFRNLGLLVATATVGIALPKSKPKEVWFAPAGVLRGCKGNNYLATGFIYAPYIPLYVTSEICVNTEFMKRFNSHRAIPYTADKEAFQRQLDKIWQTVTITA